MSFDGSRWVGRVVVSAIFVVGYISRHLLYVVEFTSLGSLSIAYILAHYVPNALTKGSRVSKPLEGRISKASSFRDDFIADNDWSTMSTLQYCTAVCAAAGVAFWPASVFVLSSRSHGCHA